MTIFVKPFIVLDIGKLRTNHNNILYLSIRIYYFQSLKYVILIEFEILKNEFQRYILILSFIQKVFIFSKNGHERR